MKYVECRTHDTICIDEHIRLTVLERKRDSVTLAVVAAPHSAVRFGHGAVRSEPVDASNVRYLLPMLTGDCFTVDDIRVGVGLYLDRREIAANDDCDVQLQISRLQAVLRGLPARDERSCSRMSQTRRDQGVERAGGIEIRRLRGDARQHGERSGSCSL